MRAFRRRMAAARRLRLVILNPEVGIAPSRNANGEARVTLSPGWGAASASLPLDVSL